MFSLYHIHCKWLILALTLSSSPSLLVSALTLGLNYSHLTPFDYDSPFFSFGVAEFSVNAPVVLANPLDGCSTLVSPNGEGFHYYLDKIIFLEPLHCSIETKIKNCQAVGCVAGISYSAFQIPGEEMWTQWDGTHKQELTVPFVHLGKDNAGKFKQLINSFQSALKTPANDNSNSNNPASSDPLLSSNLTLYISLDSQHSLNLWQEAYDSIYFIIIFQVLLGLGHMFLLFAAGRKCYLYWQTRDVRKQYAHVPIATLILVCFSCFERALVCFLDPLGSRQMMPRVYRRILVYFSVPYTYAAMLLLIFFWMEAINKHRFKPLPFLSTSFQIPFIVISIALGLVDIIFSVLDSFYVTDMILLPVIEIIYSIAGFIIAVMLFTLSAFVIKRFSREARIRSVSLSELIHQPQNDTIEMSNLAETSFLEHAKRLQKKNKEKLNRLAKFMIGAGLGMMTFLFITASTPWAFSVMQTPMQVITRQFLLYLSLAIINLSQLCAF
jgi:hypothetical protein